MAGKIDVVHRYLVGDVINVGGWVIIIRRGYSRDAPHEDCAASFWLAAPRATSFFGNRGADVGADGCGVALLRLVL